MFNPGKSSFLTFQESSLFTKFLPMISSLLVEDHTRILAAKLPEEQPQTATPPSDLFLTFVKENPIASYTTLYYSLQVLLPLYRCFCFWLRFSENMSAYVCHHLYTNLILVLYTLFDSRYCKYFLSNTERDDACV